MVIRIPIEVQTSESTEIRSLLDRIDQAEAKLQTMRNTTQVATVPGRADLAELLQPTGITRDTSRTFRSALGGEVSRTTPIGTPLEGTSDAALPRGRGGVLPGGGAPGDLIRDNQFRALQDDVFSIEQQMNKALGLGGQAVGLAGTLKQGSILKLLEGPIGKALPPLLAIMFAKEVAEMVLDILLGPGGPWDRKFKRDFVNEYNTMRSREQKGAIRTGQQEIRISYGPIGKRIKSYDASTTLSNVKSGIYPQEELAYGVIGVP